MTSYGSALSGGNSVSGPAFGKAKFPDTSRVDAEYARVQEAKARGEDPYAGFSERYQEQSEGTNGIAKMRKIFHRGKKEKEGPASIKGVEVESQYSGADEKPEAWMEPEKAPEAKKGRKFGLPSLSGKNSGNDTVIR